MTLLVRLRNVDPHLARRMLDAATAGLVFPMVSATADPVYRPQILRSLEHSAGHWIVAFSCGGARPIQLMGEHCGAGSSAPAQPRRVELDLTHALCVVGEYDIVGASRDRHRGVDHGHEVRAALPVDLHARHAGVKPASTAATRPMAGASPFGWHWPRMASSTSSGGRPVRFSNPRVTALGNADASIRYRVPP
jgi:hypothetical protein